MNKTADFDEAPAHEHFSKSCFNKTWDYIEIRERTEGQNDEMIQTCMASLWHWSQRKDATSENKSVGCWQASRVYALAGYADVARRYARLCLDHSEGLDDFYIAYAHEAMARSEKVAGNHAQAAEHLEAARRHCEKVEDAQSRQMVEADLDTIS